MDTDNFSPINDFLTNQNHYYRSSYLPQQENGKQLEKNYYNVDLQNIPFADSLFDLVITSDVMEHVRDIDRAHREIHRVLKPGGFYIFTVPYNHNLESTQVLVDTTTDQDVFLCDPVYHGDALSKGILSYRIFGRDLVSELDKIGFSTHYQIISSDEQMIPECGYFVAKKTV